MEALAAGQQGSFCPSADFISQMSLCLPNLKEKSSEAYTRYSPIQRFYWISCLLGITEIAYLLKLALKTSMYFFHFEVRCNHIILHSLPPNTPIYPSLLYFKVIASVFINY